MNTSELESYADREKATGELIATDLLSEDVTIKDPLALYPEYDLDRGCGLHRPGVNLGALLFLFPKVVAYVPAITRQQFPARFGVDFETFMRLSDPALGQHRFVHPVLNHPKYYSAAGVVDALSPLVELYPPTWERWHAALASAGGDRWFSLCDSVVDYSHILEQRDIVAKWEDEYPAMSRVARASEIRQQIRNKFVDLCLVGRRDHVVDLAKASPVDPHLFMIELSYCSSLFAYPKVLGAGGTPNFVTPEPERYLEIAASTGQAEEYLHKILDAEVTQAIIEGFHFHQIPRVFHLDFLLQWHNSEMADSVRQAYAKLLAMAKSDWVDLEDFHSAVKTILTSLRDFSESSYADPEFVGAKVQERQTQFTVITTLGGVLLGVLGLVYPALGIPTFVGGTVLGLLGFFPVPTRDRVQRSLVQKYFPDLPYDLVRDYQRIREFRKDTLDRLVESGRLPVDDAIGAAPDIPARTLWIPSN